MTAMSIGFNCFSVRYGVFTGVRSRKSQGYLTMPFDVCVTNYPGVVKCIQEGFEFLSDPRFLQLITCNKTVGGIMNGERLIYNSRYRFIFNHESPDHHSLWRSENWKLGQMHYILNNFEFFRKRYEARSLNAINMILNNKRILLLSTRFQPDHSQVVQAVKMINQNINVEVTRLTPPEGPQFVMDSLTLLGLSPRVINRELEQYSSV